MPRDDGLVLVLIVERGWRTSSPSQGNAKRESRRQGACEERDESKALRGELVHEGVEAVQSGPGRGFLSWVLTHSPSEI
jgi:hypothetical protein